MIMPGDITIDISSANPKQISFFKSRKRFVGYGGARGGGKSWGIRYKIILMALKFAEIKIFLLGSNYRDLERNHVRELIPILGDFA